MNSTVFSTMELEGMDHGAFNMAKDEGIEACRAYRARLEAQGMITWLQYMTGDIFIVRAYLPEE